MWYFTWVPGVGLAVLLAIMVGGTVYPLVMANAAGQADHGLAMLLFWAMSAGFIRGGVRAAPADLAGPAPGRW